MSTPTKRGAFIVFEGIDRVGKSTQCKRLAEFLNAEGHKTELMVFPDRTTDFGKTIDAYLQNKANLNDRMIHLLFSLNRHEASRKILETLESGTSIVCDRYCYSGAAYTMAKSTKEQEFDYEWCIMPDVGLPQPDVICFLDMAVAESMKRADFGGERYEKKDFQERIRGNFHYIRTRTEGHGPEWKEFDATKAMDDITAEIKAQMKPIVQKVASSKVGFLSRSTVLPSENAPTPPAEKATEAGAAMDVDEAGEGKKDLKSVCSALQHVANFMESELNTPSDEKWLADLKRWADTVTNRVKAKKAAAAHAGQEPKKPAEGEKTEEAPKEAKPAEPEKAEETKPAEPKKPEETAPEETKPAEAKENEKKVPETKPTEPEKAEKAPEETKPAEAEKSEEKPAEPEKMETDEKPAATDACAAAAAAAGTAKGKEAGAQDAEKKATPAKRPLADADADGNVEKRQKTTA